MLLENICLLVCGVMCVFYLLFMCMVSRLWFGFMLFVMLMLKLV